MKDVNEISIGSIITLYNTKQFFVVSNTVIDENNFVFLINVNDKKDQCFALITNDEDGIKINVIDIDDDNNEQLVNTLILSFKNNLENYLMEEGLING